mmetsp:Transcript_56317/g.123348  ORF Transcript_56317/g.123348 Transcript_56317/m.123348 type:complete len:696 (+) Transcript_56317:198-2285(+)
MVRIFLLLAAAVLGGSPITKVINLLTALRDKVEADSHREMETYSQFQDWCALENQAAARTIADAKQAIEELEAEVKSLDTERLELKADVEKLVMQISEKERDIDREIKDRQEDHAEFDEADKSYGTSLDEIKRAVAIFKDPKRQQDLLQLKDDAEKVLDSVSSLAPQSSEQLRAFFEKTANEGGSAAGPVSFLQISAPSGAAYTTSQGTNTVVKLMESIFAELKNSREAAQQEEVAAKHEFDMLKQSMEHELHSLESAKAGKADEISENSNRVSQAKSQINDELKTLQQSETYLDDVREQCKTKAEEYKERQEVRGSEMKAIDGAVGALQSAKMKQAEQRKEASYTQQPALPQESPVVDGMEASNDVVMSFVQVGDQPSGWSLEQIMTAAQQASHGGGTDKVKRMIEEMIAKLSGEAASEAQQSAWCDKEFSDTRTQKEEKEKMIEKSTGRVQNWVSNQAQLKTETKTAMEEAAEIDKGVKEASRLRKDENAENVAAIKEYKNAQKLIATAVQFLTEFYEKMKRDKQEASLLQQQQALENVAGDDDSVVLQQTAQPEDASYNGQQDSAAGILALLEVAESDYKKLEQEVTTEEQVSASEYSQYMQESKIRKAVLETEVKQKQEEITRLNGSISGGETDIKEWSGELDKINAYLDQLNGACSFKAPTFEERAKRRKAQLESLQNALAILEGEGVPT